MNDETTTVTGPLTGPSGEVLAEISISDEGKVTVAKADDKIVQGGRAIISAKYLPLLGEFRARTDEIRYYLQGVFIEPHESVGAYLCATDGHRFVVVHDEEAVIETAMLVNPTKLVIRESKHARLADFDGRGVDLQDDEEEFLLRAPAPLIDARFPDWRSLIPAEDIVCEPGSIDPGLMAAISKAPFGDGENSACIYARQDKPCVVRFPSLPEIFVLVMPMRYPAIRSNPEWINKRRKSGPAPQQQGFDLTGGDCEADDTPVADNCPATA